MTDGFKAFSGCHCTLRQKECCAEMMTREGFKEFRCPVEHLDEDIRRIWGRCEAENTVIDPDFKVIGRNTK